MQAIFYGLCSALAWGGGDFAGGLASRKTGPYQAVLFGELLGLLPLTGAALLAHPQMPGWQNMLLAGASGAIGSLGLLLLYKAMITGQMSIATPVSALLAAVLPVIISAITEGLPTPVRLAGFAFALLAVWLVAQDDSGQSQSVRLADLRLPLLAGVCFGMYFVLMHQASEGLLLGPMIASRCGGSLALAVFMLARGELKQVSNPAAWPFIALNGLLDIGGNAFYLLAGQAGRLDAAAVLSSLFPGATVLLAWLVLKERLNRLQWLGIFSALLAIGLMTIKLDSGV